MSVLKYIYIGLRRLALPIRQNFLFVVFMYVLLAVSLSLENMRDLHSLYYTELFFDLYLLCCLLYWIPRRFSRGVRLFFYVVGYATSFVEGFIYLRFYLRFSPVTMQLMAETNPDEASEFFGAYLWSEALWTVTWTFGLVLVANVLLAVYGKKLFVAFRAFVHRKTHLPLRMHPLSMLLDVVIPLFFCYSIYMAWEEKRAMWGFFFDQHNTVRAERYSWMRFYSPFYRLLYSLKFIQISSQEVKELKQSMRSIRVDSCSYQCPNIVWIIGESYNKHHAGYYGYPLPTTPYQSRFAKAGSLIVFSDVVTPWNVTSNAFKSFLSTQDINKEHRWSQGVLFPALFKKAGYKVAFITNQFNKSVRQTATDFNGSFFLNDELLDSMCFDYRNRKKYVYDKGLIKEYGKYEKGPYNLIIFHLMGQHLEYNKRFPAKDTHFTLSDIKRPELNDAERQIIADYDNATRYNDWVVARIYSYFKDDDAIIIYTSDHGDEVYDELRTFGRNHNATITPPLARSEFEVPFTVWTTRRFRRQHPDIVRAIRRVKDLPFTIEDIPHFMLGLAGIACPEYDETRDILQPRYNKARPRMLKRIVDYDELMDNEKRKP